MRAKLIIKIARWMFMALPDHIIGVAEGPGNPKN
jgi:hypothetical protein